MKRLTGFFFLALMLLNTIGYYGVLVILQRQQLDETIKKISANEDIISGNLLVKIPMALPYAQYDMEYKSANGEILVDGQIYHLVKQKLYQDTLYIVCLKDPKATQARNTIADYSKSFADKNQTSDASRKNPLPSLAKFYLSGETANENGLTGWSRTLPHYPLENHYRFLSISSVFRPPSF